tara:strand:- start:93 stop:335 length:243 start_codon:yes stop_codon:yes gene_type:complete
VHPFGVRLIAALTPPRNAAIISLAYRCFLPLLYLRSTFLRCFSVIYLNGKAFATHSPYQSSSARFPFPVFQAKPKASDFG